MESYDAYSTLNFRMCVCVQKCVNKGLYQQTKRMREQVCEGELDLLCRPYQRLYTVEIFTFSLLLFCECIYTCFDAHTLYLDHEKWNTRTSRLKRKRK